HVAVVGESGTGKSTFINAIRGLSSGSAGSATSSINECNATVTRYEDPRHTDLVWYDVPGSNTATVTCWSYFMDQGLFAFDALVLVFSNRFTQTVSTVLKNAKTCNKPVFLVRTMADQIMANFRVDTGNQLASDDD
ncbi:immunity-related GTPases-like protein, partial [Panaeolus papilionaceus]